MKRVVMAWLLVALMALGAVPVLAETPAMDRAGNPISVPEVVQSIISLAPSTTEVIVDLGFGDRLIAVDTYGAQVEGVPGDIPAFDMMSPDMEQIIALSPDVVFVTEMSLVEGDDPFAVLAEMGVCVAHIPSSESIAGILEDTLFIGGVLGAEAEAQALNDILTEAINTYTVTREAPVAVYFEISPMPYLYSFGTGTFLNEMIEMLGGHNILADQDSWLSVSEEAVLAAAPEIIFTNVNWEPDAVGEILARPGWESVPAVRDGRVYLIDSDTSSRPNHRIVKALEEMSQAFEN